MESDKILFGRNMIVEIQYKIERYSYTNVAFFAIIVSAFIFWYVSNLKYEKMKNKEIIITILMPLGITLVITVKYAIEEWNINFTFLMLMGIIIADC